MNKYICTFSIGDRIKTVTIYAYDEYEAASCAKHRVKNEFRGAKCLVKKI